MQWWCSARGVPWDWSWTAYPGVWLFILVLVTIHVALRCASGAERPGASDRSPADVAARPRKVRRRLEIASFAGGVLLLWIALDWPLGALGAGYLAAAHAVQFLLIALVAPPLLLLGIPTAAYRRLEARPRALAVLRLVTRPLIAFPLFNIVIGLTHWPRVVDTLMATQPGSFVLDLSWLLAALVFWWPVVAPVPRRPGFSHPLKIGYLIANTIAGTAVFIFLAFSEFPLYAVYELAPPIEWLDTRADQQVAGFIMKVGGGLAMWTAITVVFVHWLVVERRREGQAR
jgi:putative membrane protein